MIDWKTLIRHARPTVLLPAGGPANEVSESAGFAPLITTVGGAPLLPSSCASDAELCGGNFAERGPSAIPQPARAVGGAIAG